MNGTELRNILLVEDNPADVLVIKTALRKLNLNLRVNLAADGQTAIDYLSGKLAYRDRSLFPLPHLILLDLSLPVVHGFQVLEWVRTEPFLNATPVVILATSCHLGDIQRAYDFGANSFITKPNDLDKLIRDLQAALDYWLYRQIDSPHIGLQSAA